MKYTQKKPTGKNGGVRPGAGRKPKPEGEKAVTVSLSLPAQMHAKLSLFADSKGLTVNDAIREMITKSTRKISVKNPKEN